MRTQHELQYEAQKEADQRQLHEGHRRHRSLAFWISTQRQAGPVEQLDGQDDVHNGAPLHGGHEASETARLW